MFDLPISRRTGITKLLLAIILVAAMAFASYAVMVSDESDADALVDSSHYYRDRMSSDEARTVYDNLVAAPITLEGGNYVVTTSIPISDEFIGQNEASCESEMTSHYDQILSEVLRAVPLDHPELFYLGNHIALSGSTLTNGSNVITGGTRTFTFDQLYTGYGNDAASVAATNAQLAAVASGITIDSTNDLTKIQSINQWIISTLNYDTDKPEGMGCRNIGTAMLSSGHLVVCEGYAKTFKYLCDLNGIRCITVTGQAVGSGSPEGHMWNYVQMLSGIWYMVDCTWNDQSSSTYANKYLLVGSSTVGLNDKTVAQSHAADDQLNTMFGLPTLSTNDYLSGAITITWLNADDSVIASQTYGQGEPVTAPADPTYVNAAVGTYTFNQWDQPVPTTATGDMTLKAMYNITYKPYVYTFKNWDGSTLSSTTYHYNDTVTAPAEPSRAAVGETTFTFAGWNTVIDAMAVTENREYIATYSSVTQTPNGAIKVEFDGASTSAIDFSETLSITEVDLTTLSPALQDKLNGHKVYSIDFGTNNNAFTAGTAKVFIKHEMQSGERSNLLKVFYLNGENLEKVKGSHFEKGYMVFTTNHFSDYAVMNEEDDDGSSDGIIGIIMENYILILILLFAIIGMALSYKFS